MAKNAPKSYDTDLKELLQSVDKGRLQLPEFQRSWTWDDLRIRNIIASLTQAYPMGAIMQLKCGGDEVRLKYRPFEGTTHADKEADALVLDGQQRLTSLYLSLYSRKPVPTTNERGQRIERLYYLDMRKCLDPDEDRVDAIVSVPKTRKVTEDIGRTVVLDLSARELEIERLMFPANLVFDASEKSVWWKAYIKHYGFDSPEEGVWNRFNDEVLDTMDHYKVPVITLDKDTPREAVCKVFENVNTGGVSLTVFELVTATFATYDFDLRKSWEKHVKPEIRGVKDDIKTDVMNGVDAVSFLTSMTLLTTFEAKASGTGHTTCKKRDVLALDFDDYEANLDRLIDGFRMAREFLMGERVYRMRDLPYTTQLIPLAATCAHVGRKAFDRPSTKNVLRQWFWCGILGEMYGGANETRYANDIDDLVDVIEGRPSQRRTVSAAYFQSTRLLGLQTRNSAAYKGIMALLFKASCLDFIDGEKMDMIKAMSQETEPDIHHIFPRAYCEKVGLDRVRWNSIVNKTPLIPRTNRILGGVAPSRYIPRILRESAIDEETLRKRVESHLIDYDMLAHDDFDGFFVDRAKRLLDLIEGAMGKAVPDRSSDETIRVFGVKLAD